MQTPFRSYLHDMLALVSFLLLLFLKSWKVFSISWGLMYSFYSTVLTNFFQFSILCGKLLILLNDFLQNLSFWALWSLVPLLYFSMMNYFMLPYFSNLLCQIIYRVCFARIICSLLVALISVHVFLSSVAFRLTCLHLSNHGCTLLRWFSLFMCFSFSFCNGCFVAEQC